MPRWLTWVGVTVLTAVGVVGGAAVARAVIRPRFIDPELDQAASAVVARYGSGVPLAVLTDRAYWSVRPSCPRRLDPELPAHADCIRAWFQLRTLIAGKLPPPVIPTPNDRPDLKGEGPAADVRRWLASLSAAQQRGLRQEIGAAHYDAIATAAAAGDDAGTIKALRRLKKEIDDLADDDPLEALRRYRALKSLLGDRFDELAQLAEKYSELA